ncbi:jg17416, partial [Pararge aegeria aegeria]
MDSSFYPEIEENYGIDMSEYYIDKNSFNPIVYIHKKHLMKNSSESSYEKRTNSHKHDKSQQFDYDRLNSKTYKTKVVTSEYTDPLVDETIKFAKDIIPITIPPSTNIDNPCYYTVKAYKKTKRKHEPQEYIECPRNTMNEKEKSKHTLNVKHRKCSRNKSSQSPTSVTHFSENNTIDDINENQSSFTYSFSEMSDDKQKKEEFAEKNKKHNVKNTKLVASESFEAIATEYINSLAESKSKVPLMNDKDKHSLCENIRSPVLKAIKERFDELINQNDRNTEMQNVNKVLRCHAKKLDNILEKLTSIENKLDSLS